MTNINFIRGRTGDDDIKIVNKLVRIVVTPLVIQGRGYSFKNGVLWCAVMLCGCGSCGGSSGVPLVVEGRRYSLLNGVLWCAVMVCVVDCGCGGSCGGPSCSVQQISDLPPADAAAPVACNSQDRNLVHRRLSSQLIQALIHETLRPKVFG